MKAKEAYDKILTIYGIPFSKLFSESELLLIKKNKGKAGQLLELTLGKKLDSSELDFEDGELKTNKCDINGEPEQTIFITQISSSIDDIFRNKSFKETNLYKKITYIVYVPVCKKGDPKDWRFLEPIIVDLSDERLTDILKQLEFDYNKICKDLKEYVEDKEKGLIHTSNGKYLQVRTKDTKPYHPIYSKIYKRNISNKNYAFYFKRQFIIDLKKLVKIEKGDN